MDTEILNDGDDEIMIEDVLQNNVTIAEEKKTAGNDQYKRMNYKNALKLYTDAITLCPNTAAYYGNRAACYMMIGDCNSALKDSKIAIQLDDKFEKGYIRMTKCYILLGDIIRAEQTIQKLLLFDSKNLSIKTELQTCNMLKEYEDKAKISYDKNDYRTVVYYMDMAIKVSRNCQKYKLLRAECLALLGRVEEACDIAVTVMKTDSSSVDAIYIRGLCLYFNDNLEKGLTHFERVLVLDPDHKKAKSMRIKAKMLKEKKEKGNELFKTLQFKDAHIVYTEALAIDELNKDINSKLYYNRALVNAKLGYIRDAIADCSSALLNNPKYTKALLRRAKCYYDMENFEECVKDYETAANYEKTPEIKNLLKDAKLALKKSKRKDYYKILGIGKSANNEEIKKAYRKRALVHHPDRHANSTADEKQEQEKKFKEVGEAYNVLSDPQKKARYDSGQDIDDDQSGFDPNQMFYQFFKFPSGSNDFAYQFNN